ncbi:MAG: DUF5818 domain-containing protein [Chakrabartia sp.]
MTPSFMVEHFEVTGVLDMAPRGFTYLLTMDNGQSWSLNLGKYWRPRRFLGLRITAIGPRCGERIIEVLRLYIHDADGDSGHWVL